MEFINKTKNQHFISQVEQKLNASVNNPRKIYSFTLGDREEYKLNLDCPKGVSIENNLSLNDLFSFDVIRSNPERYNFEGLFGKYEKLIKNNTESLLKKIKKNDSDIKNEILNIFVLKMVNFARNPFSIQKVLNTFPSLLTMYPLDSKFEKIFDKVLSGKKPHQQYLCNELGITEDIYRDWLTIIFMLLTPFDSSGINILEHSVKSLCESKDNMIFINIYTYDEQCCLLSDRGFSNPIPDCEHMAWSFNLFAKGFIQYMFADWRSFIPENTPNKYIEGIKRQNKKLNVCTHHNDYEQLEIYNKNVVYQCYKKVYCSSSAIYGL
ncbi:hypothetical protein [Vibrio metschnikovii]|uniref:hypothetical protein n=1 Tax=Vibrio metschnikovii TaxID=28172 RepID=UPI001CCFD10B|nr:hypothetical protein [Vibrio metschnikovii]